jgi:hypothetical protein
VAEKVTSVDKFHREIPGAVFFEEVAETHEVRVQDPLKSSKFILEAEER